MASMEAGVLIDLKGNPLYWHLPAGRSGGSLPDSSDLWRVIWENRDCIAGFAHSHPSRGVPGPSYEDVTTFAAIEAALGRRLRWWIASADKTVICDWTGPGKHTYPVSLLLHEPEWVEHLRQESFGIQDTGRGEVPYVFFLTLLHMEGNGKDVATPHCLGWFPRVQTARTVLRSDASSLVAENSSLYPCYAVIERVSAGLNPTLLPDDSEWYVFARTEHGAVARMISCPEGFEDTVCWCI